MPSDLDLLVPRFREKVPEVISHCKGQGIEMMPYFIVRYHYKQARLRRQSNIESAGPRYERHAANALSGLSRHRWGQAVDCMWTIDGKSEWQIKKNQEI